MSNVSNKRDLVLLNYVIKTSTALYNTIKYKSKMMITTKNDNYIHMTDEFLVKLILEL